MRMATWSDWPELATELVRLNIDVVVCRDDAAVRAVQQATSTIPGGHGLCRGPGGDGLVASLPRPAVATLPACRPR
jgi:putative ABC transport system substrate-binding protein